jgi:hypothetical protein
MPLGAKLRMEQTWFVLQEDVRVVILRLVVLVLETVQLDSETVGATI